MIKKAILSAILASVAACLFSQEQMKPADFKKFGFSVEFPGYPEFSSDTSYLGDTPVITKIWSISVNDSLHPNLYYSVGQSVYPSDFIHSDSAFTTVEGFINSTQNSVFADSTHRFLSAVMLEKNGYPGKSFKWKNIETDIYFEFQVFLVENKLYELSVVTKPENTYNTLINNFFDSFSPVGIPDGNYKTQVSNFKATYEISFPGEAKSEVKVIDSDAGKIEMGIMLLDNSDSMDDDNMVYISAEAVYPQNMVNYSDTADVNGFYRRSINGSVTSINGELFSVKDITMSGFPGKEYKCYMSNRMAIAVYRIMLKSDHLYTTGVITLTQNDGNKTMTDFFNSFTLKQ